ncbi:MAG: hypothetical protein OXE83_05530 [Gammaproteobacteria bacterium]|nr:hypothetical protein [Gammaproteobacteria bacterium]
MDFNADLAKKICAERSPRDRAHYFEGRRKELAAIRSGLAAATEVSASIFRIIQGPPGCGKTSLAFHAGQSLGEDAAFIPVRHAHLKGDGPLLNRIQSVAERIPGKAYAAAAKWAAASAAKFAGQPLSEKLGLAAEKAALKGLSLLIHVDEAHSLPDQALETLKDLHIGGVGEGEHVPTVILLTGLQHSRFHLASHPGLTRCGDEATYDLGPLTAEECCASTGRMLSDLLPEPSPNSISTALAEASSNLSFGHPRHLLSAQQAICDELLRVNGSLSDVADSNIESACAQKRNHYYRFRLTEVTRDPLHLRAIQRVLVQLATDSIPGGFGHILHMVQEELSETGPIPPTKKEVRKIAQNIIARGIIQRENDLWAVAIPSMASWAEDMLDPVNPATAPSP